MKCTNILVLKLIVPLWLETSIFKKDVLVNTVGIIKQMVKQSRYRPGGVQRVPGS